MSEVGVSGVKSAARVLDILEWVALRPEPSTLQNVVNHFKFPKSSALALMATLVDRGYLTKDSRDRYHMPPSMRARWATDDVGQLLVASHPPMRALNERLQETVILGVLDRHFQVRVLSKLASPQEVRYDADASIPRPAYCTAMGRVLLAHRPKHEQERYLQGAPFPKLTPTSLTSAAALRKRFNHARKTGLETVIEEFSLGGSGAAVALRNARGEVVAALNVATVTSRFEGRQHLILQELERTAAQIGERLGASQLPGNPRSA